MGIMEDAKKNLEQFGEAVSDAILMKVENAHEFFELQLGMTLTMEHDSLMMLEELEQAADTAQVKKMFAHHAEETRGQIANIEKAFTLTEIAQDSKTSPVTKGLATQGKMLVAKTDGRLRDLAVLTAASGTEHFEIASYRSLITLAEHIGFDDAASLFGENLEQEEHTAKELEAALTDLKLA